MYVLLILFFASVGAHSPLLSSADYWLPEDLYEIRNLSSISEQCRKDLTTWMERLFAFGPEFDSCVIKKSSNCTTDIKKQMKEDFYALKQLDAFGKIPPGLLEIAPINFGSLSECRDVGNHFYYQTHYCYVQSHIGQRSCDVGPGPIRSAVCMPLSCTEEDIPKIFNHTGPKILNHCTASCVPLKGETSVFLWIFVSFMGVLTYLILLSTLVDYFMDIVKPNIPGLKESLVLKFLFCFSFYTNGYQILDTKPARKGHLKSLDCIRFFSMIWVVEGHIAGFWFGSDSLWPLRTILKPILADTVASGFFSVDTFFTLSGLLVAYMFFKMTLKNKEIVKKPATWILFYVHRYLRLTPPYMLFICFFMAISPFLIGIYSEGIRGDADICKKYWWHNLLYINNFQDQAKQCYGISWYLSVDTQLYLVSPIFLMALYFNHFIGLGLIVLACAGSVAATFYIIMHYGLVGTLARIDNSEKHDMFFNKLYFMPWIRCTTYLIGIYAGYLLANFPKINRRINPIFPTLGWCFFIGVALAIVYGPHKYLDYQENWSTFVRALYYSFSRIGWGLFICWTILANYYGYGGPIGTFMEHPLWQPLGRLSYTAYLVHIFTAFYFLNLSDRPVHFVNLWQQISDATSTTCNSISWLKRLTKYILFLPKNGSPTREEGYYVYNYVDFEFYNQRRRDYSRSVYRERKNATDILQPLWWVGFVLCVLAASMSVMMFIFSFRLALQRKRMRRFIQMS